MSLIDPWFYDHRISGKPMLTADELNRRNKQLDKENEAMTRTYTAADFANARFAEHENGQLATRDTGDPDYPWGTNYAAFHDHDMADHGWVPVPTNPTITESDYRFYENRVGEGNMSVASLMHRLNIEVIPDPEPTNTDRLERLIRESGFEVLTLGRIADTRELAEWLNRDGVTAPKEDK